MKKERLLKVQRIIGEIERLEQNLEALRNEECEDYFWKGPTKNDPTGKADSLMELAGDQLRAAAQMLKNIKEG